MLHLQRKYKVSRTASITEDFAALGMNLGRHIAAGDRPGNCRAERRSFPGPSSTGLFGSVSTLPRRVPWRSPSCTATGCAPDISSSIPRRFRRNLGQAWSADPQRASMLPHRSRQQGHMPRLLDQLVDTSSFLTERDHQWREVRASTCMALL